MGIRRPGRRTNAPVFVVRHESSVVGVPFMLRPQARGCTPREQGFTIRCFVDPGKPPCQGPPRPITLTPAQPSRPETRPRTRGPSSTRGSKPPLDPLCFPPHPLAPRFLFPSPCSATYPPMALRRRSCNFRPLCTQIASEPSADAIVTPLSCFHPRRLSPLEADGAQARVCNKYVCVRVYLVYVRGIADAGSIGETKNASPDCDEEV